MDRSGTFGSWLGYMEGVVAGEVHTTYRYFPLAAAACLAAWLFVLVRRKEYYARLTMIAALALLGLYQLFMSTAGGYADWPRLYMTLNPLRLIVTIGTLLIAAAATAPLIEARVTRMISRRASLAVGLIGAVELLAAGFILAPPRETGSEGIRSRRSVRWRCACG